VKHSSNTRATAAPDLVPYEAFLREQDVLALVGVSRSTLRRWIANKRFPDSIELPARVIAWPRSVVLAWMQERSDSTKASSSTCKPGARTKLPGVVPCDTFLRKPQVLALVGVSPSTLGRWIAKKRFPKGIELSARIVVWPLSVVLAWMEACRTRKASGKCRD
jgi:predicted DNA-binding transcriptional regulator AlpA